MPMVSSPVRLATASPPMAGRRLLAVALMAAAVLTGIVSSPAAAQGRTLPPRLWGVTLDNTAGIPAGALSEEVASLQALPTMPIARIVMDVGTRPGVYATAVAALHPVSYLMAELGDSSEMRRQSVAAYQRFEASLVAAYSSTVDLWEVANEVNGEWVGSTTKEVAKISDAYDSVKAVGGLTALTLYYNPDCWTKRSHAMFTWAQNNIPAAMKAGLDDVLISYYPDDCHNYWPTQAEWQSVFDQLHAMFPHAQLGFGESGISTDTGSPATKAALLTKYYTLDISGDNFVGGDFWWYYAEDAVPYQGNAVWNALDTAMTSNRPSGSAGARRPSVGGGRPASCRARVIITKLRFAPAAVVPGHSSTVHLSARSCQAQSEHTDLTTVGQFTGSDTSGCPIIDPVVRHVTFTGSDVIKSKLTYQVPAPCQASHLGVTVTFSSSSSGARLAQKTAVLAIR